MASGSNCQVLQNSGVDGVGCLLRVVLPRTILRPLPGSQGA
ncbi:hypothetical protein FHW23_001037 [Curtobacterium pusillum]|uniref:Uncharacterized protein n=1 Tax=Curtobacterium pusillum TaxID=69373 RepID=A0AAW3T5A6_9MICO|nr:hypothetical protein [Curtobacterium pusillum]